MISRRIFTHRVQHADAAFAAHKHKHARVYADAKEEAQRRTNFVHNKRMIESKNRAGLSFRLALNHLADSHVRWPCM